MAKDGDLKTKHEAVTFEDNPVEFCRQIYAESIRRSDDLRPIDLENRMFYEGKDSQLDDRKGSKTVAHQSPRRGGRE